MTNVTEVFALAKQYGLTSNPPFVGTFAQLAAAVEECQADDFYAHQEQQAEAAVERYYEGGWPGADQYRWEEEQDRMRNPFDPQAWHTAMVFA